MSEYRELYDAIVDGKEEEAEQITKKAIEAGVDPQVLLDEYMMPAMDEVGRRFEANDCFVPEMLMASAAMKNALKTVQPRLSDERVKSAVKVIIGTVRGDLHDIGKNLVGGMLEGGGFNIVDLGVDVEPRRFVETVKESDARVIAMSALLTTTMEFMRKTVEALNEAGLRDKVKIIIGGAPITQEYADEIGADGYGRTAGSAVGVARELLQISTT